MGFCQERGGLEIKGHAPNSGEFLKYGDTILNSEIEVMSPIDMAPSL
jgi:hypothetical protein